MPNAPLRLAILLLLPLAACPGVPGDELEEFAIMELRAEDVPPSPTNRYADDPGAVALGRRLFADPRMSADGRVSCASCHRADQGLSDDRAFSIGVFGRVGARHSMPIGAAVLQSFLFSDGRADSAWSQPLKAIESTVEMDFSRAEVAHFIERHHQADYEAVFGALPALEDVPARARPGLPEWDAMSAEQQDGVQRVFANVGKSLEAFERRVLCADTRFDRWVRGEIELEPREEAGARGFVHGGCIACHSGPGFSDGAFHDLGIDDADPGRAGAYEQLLADTFNGVGPYSDDRAAGERRLAQLDDEGFTENAFRTATLRGVGQRRSFGHNAHRAELRDFIVDVYGRRQRDAADPLLRNVNVGNVDDLVAFLGTLDCPPPPQPTRPAMRP